MDLGRILVVDDEAPVREVLTEYFSTEGYAVEAATSGVEALIAVRGGRADLVLLDVRMPGLDGVQVLQRIRELTESVPVIMVTANEDVGLAKETLKLGAFDYVAKPFDFDYLDRAVAAGLARAAEKAAGGSVPGDDPWKRFTRTVFRVARAMGQTARTSTGERLETAALAAARDAAAGRGAVAGEHLTEIAMLLDLAAEFGDLPAADRALVESAIEAARRALPVPSRPGARAAPPVRCRAASQDPPHRRGGREPHARRRRGATDRGRRAHGRHRSRDFEPPSPLPGRQDARAPGRARHVRAPAGGEPETAPGRRAHRPRGRHGQDGPDRQELRGPERPAERPSRGQARADPGVRVRADPQPGTGPRHPLARPQDPRSIRHAGDRPPRGGRRSDRRGAL